MTHLFSKSMFAAAAAALVAGSAANAGTICWDQQQAQAARIRTFQASLRAATRQCTAAGIDITPAYNAFIRANAPTLIGAGNRIQAQLAAQTTGSAAPSYDQFISVVAAPIAFRVSLCRETAKMARKAAAAKGDASQLAILAEAAGVAPELPGGECRLNIAQAGQ